MGLGQSPRVASIFDTLTTWLGWEDCEPDTITVNRWEWRCESITNRFLSPRNALWYIYIYPGVAQSLKTINFVPFSDPQTLLLS